MTKSILTTRTVLVAALAAMLPATVMAQEPWRAERLTISAPAATATIDDLKGEPSMLAWSPDGSQLYFQTREGAFGKPDAKLRHYVIAVADGKVKDVDAQPEWAADYWSAKSGQASPDDPAFKIELKSEAQKARTTSVPMGGDLARGGTVGADATGTTNEDSIAAAMNSQTIFINTMLLKGQTIGLFENTVIVPGLTFGWGPKGTKIIAFAARNGRVIALDATGAKKEVEGSKDAVLPAWSPDGSKLAWLQKDGRKKVVLQVASVATS